MSDKTAVDGGKIELTAKRTVTIEEVEGGLYFVGYLQGDKPTKKAATSSGALFKTLTEVFQFEKKQRTPRKPKEKKEK